MQTNFELLKEMKKRVLASNACVDSLLSVPPDSGTFYAGIILLMIMMRQSAESFGFF